MVQPTSKAVRHLQELLAAREASEGLGLRLAVERGGCAGLQYSMKIDGPAAGDEVIETGGVRIFVQRDSAAYLEGAQLDYNDSLNDAGFRIENPNAVRSCGCGTSFETKPSS